MECTFSKYGFYRDNAFSTDELKKYGKRLLETKYKQYIPVYYEAVDKCVKLADEKITKEFQEANFRPCQIKPAFMYECIKSEMIDDCTSKRMIKKGIYIII